MTAQAMAKNGRPRMIMTDASLSISKIMKLTRKMNLLILTNRKSERGIILMLAPKFAKAFFTRIVPIRHELLPSSTFFCFLSRDGKGTLDDLEGWWRVDDKGGSGLGVFLFAFSVGTSCLVAVSLLTAGAELGWLGYEGSRIVNPDLVVIANVGYRHSDRISKERGHHRCLP
nr:hypothetical protein [Tanacetum cinerariifolium]